MSPAFAPTPHRQESSTVTVPRRYASTIATGLVLGVALVAATPAFAAEVTNPADHPSPVTVKIDGQEFHDGLDTLPGFDDYACTAIPGVEYDFPNGRILYYDDANKLLDTADWSEWDRISSYGTWQKQQAAAATPTPSAPTGPSSSNSSSNTSASTDTSNPAASAPSTSQSTPAPAASAPSTSTQSTSTPSTSTSTTSGSSANPSNSSKSGNSSKPSGGKKSKDSSSDSSSKGPAVTTAGAAGGTGAAVAAGATSDDPAGTTADDAAASTPGVADRAPKPDDIAVTNAEIAGPPAPAGVAADPTAKALPGVAVEDGSTTLAGVGILGALSLAGLALLSGNFVRRHALGGRGPIS